MLYKVCLIQILLYLFIVPLIRLVIQDEIINYKFGISIVFLASFLVSGYFSRALRQEERSNHQAIFYMPEKIDFKWLLFVLFVLVSAFISYKYELYNPRIGTEEAAMRAAQVPPLFVVIFRSLGIALPVFIAIVMAEILKCKRIKILTIVTVIILIFVFFITGGASSRIALGLYLLMALIINQHLLTTRQFRRISFYFILIAMFMYSAATILRVLSGDSRDLFEYVSAEVLQRLDGLEIVSRLVELHGYQFTGINPVAILNPIISSIPFLDNALILKADALTTVKSIVMIQEYDSSLRDVNSFVVLDVYYWGGMVALVIVAYVVGWTARLVDRGIGMSRGLVYQCFLMAAVVNLTVLESESISLILGIFRTWLILLLVCGLFFYKNKPSVINNT